jgi:hypothetical protein
LIGWCTFLSPQGVLVIWIDEVPDTASARRTLPSVIERLGFHTGTAKRCQNGFAISACRINAGQRAAA